MVLRIFVSALFLVSSILGVRGLPTSPALQSLASCVNLSLTTAVSADLLSSLISELTLHLLRDHTLNPKYMLCKLHPPLDFHVVCKLHFTHSRPS